MNIKLYEYINKNWVLIIAIIGFATYFQTLTFGLTYCDDHDIIINNFDRIKDFNNIGKEFLHGYIGTDYYRPMINLSFLLNAQIAGQSPYMYHFVNIFLHIIFCLSLVVFLKRMNVQNTVAVTCGAIFAVHPLTTNAVAWIVGRNDTIFAIFAIWAIIFYIDYMKQRENKVLVYHFLMLLFAFLSKESSLLLPIILSSYTILIAKENPLNKINIRLFGSWILAFLIWFSLRSISTLGESVNRMGWDVIQMNIRVIPEFVAKFIFPFDLSVLATYNNFNTLLGLIIIAVLLVFTFRLKGLDKNKILFGMLLFIILLVPSILVNIKNSADWNEYVECRSYLPIVGLILIILEFYKVIKNKRIVLNIPYFVIGLILFFMIVTNIESSNYKGNISFYESAIRDNPTRSLFHFVLSRHYRTAGNITLEERELLKSYELKNTYSKYPFNIGVFYYNQGNISKAIEYFNKAINLDSLHFGAYKSLGNSYFAAGKLDEAIGLLKIAVTKFKDNGELYLNLCVAYAYQNNFDEIKKNIAKLIASPKDANRFSSFLFERANYFYLKADYKNFNNAIEVSLLANENNIDSYNLLISYNLEIVKNKAKSIFYANLILQKGGTMTPENAMKIKEMN